MSIRKRITLLITGAGFLASLVFSIAVFQQMADQPMRSIDSELEATGRMAALMVLTKRDHPGAPPTQIFPEVNRYWFKIYDHDSNKVLYRSYLATVVDVPQRRSRFGYNVTVPVPRGLLKAERNWLGKVPFRVMMFDFSLDGKSLILQIGRPIEHLEDETWETIWGLAGGLVSSTLVLLVIGYITAGIILKPIRTIGDLARDINAKSLDKRIPVGDGCDEFNELARTINRMFDRLQHSFTRQKRFLADASHDLKTPLTMMRLFIDDVLSQDREGLPDLLRDHLLRQNVQVLRMERLVKDLLDLSSLEMTESVKAEPVDLGPLIHSLLEDYRLLAETRRIRIGTRLPETLKIRGDREKISRALSNILDNAVKYNQDGGKIQLEVKNTDRFVAIHVANTGDGIPETESDKVFNQFYRVESSRSSQYGGSGLGLAIVKRIIELHGGDVTMTSKPAGWTTVTVLFPKPH